jgi:Nitroreductase family
MMCMHRRYSAQGRGLRGRKLPVVDELWRELLDDARWAPSPHNTQPWKLRVVEEREAELLYDPERLLPDTDADGRFMTVALGMFVEAIVVAAAARGHDLAVGYDGRPLDPQAPGPALFATLRLVQYPRDEPLDRELLLERKTSRLRYDGRPLDEGLLEELRELAADYGQAFSWTSEPGLVRKMVALNEETLFSDLNDPVIRSEIGRWLRISAAEAERRRDGVEPAALGLPGLLLRVFFRAHGLLELPGIHGTVRRRYRRTMRGTRTVGWLSGPFESPAERFTAGRMLLRFWLTLTREGAQLHPFGSLITNAVAYARLHELVGNSTTGTLWLVARFGYSVDPPRSRRLDVGQLLA